MVKYCPVCHEDNLSNARFCSSCGSVIAHIEATFSGLGTAHKGSPASSSALPATHLFRTKEDTGLADQMVAISEARQVSQGHRSSERFWRSPKAVAGLAGLTILTLIISLGWIIQGRQSFDAQPPSQTLQKQGVTGVEPLASTEQAPTTPRTLPITNLKAAPTGGVLPIEVEPNLPATQSPPVAVQVQPQSLPSSAVLRKESVAKLSSQKVPAQTSSLQKSAAQTEPKQKESKQKESKQKESPIEALKPVSGRERVASGSTAIAPQAKVTSSSDAKPPDAARLSGKSVHGAGNVEALCADRNNFLSRGYCQNQYCAEPHRKGDPTCQRLRQYELARQTINY